MRVQVHADRCQGHGMCRLICPQIFRLNDDDGHATALTEAVPRELEEKALQAQRSCPEQAIEVEE
jgi:ferredoxin